MDTGTDTPVVDNGLADTGSGDVDAVDADLAEAGMVDSDRSEAGMTDIDPVDSGVPCPSGTADCNGLPGDGCEVNITTTSNCGACGRACASIGGTASCSGGLCAISCSTGLDNCNGILSDGCESNTNTSATNCGACNNVCSLPNATAGCVAGACTVASCNAGFANCDGDPANGCEVNLNSDNANCGACSTPSAMRACTAPQLCSAGACQSSCGTGQVNCSSVCRNLATDPDSCGACGTVCSGAGVVSRTCAGGACNGVCSAGRANCDGNLQVNGCETDVNTSVAQCGGCTGMACSTNNIAAACVGGTCAGACVTGFADCDGDKRTNGCETNTVTTAAHCGMCGQACPTPANSVAVCIGSSCGITCTAGFGSCDGTNANGCETNLNTTATHCGACGNACQFANAAASCAAGRCAMGACNAGFANCDGNPANGCEVNIASGDIRNCGNCGMICPAPPVGASAVCNGSMCGISGLTCPSDRRDCNAVAADGCETAVLTDVNNCGACGARCSTTGGTASCAGGACAIACNAGLGNCDGNGANGCETQLNTTAHCGACGTTCAVSANSTPVCTGGSCGVTCTPGFGNCDGNSANGCETNLQSGPFCGSCLAVCPPGVTCVSGICTNPTQRSCTPAVAGCGLVTMVGGPFGQGENSTAINASPAQPVTVGFFTLDAYEVTVARFNAFWSVRSSALSTIRSAPIAYPGGQTIAWGASAQSPSSQSTSGCNWSATSTVRDAHPMNCLDWWLAQEFCVWDGGRLPTEAEWEYAARGRVVAGLSVPRAYPWGDTNPTTACDRALWNNCAGTDGGSTRRVGGFAAPGALFDMAGSVWEWTADNYGGYPSCRLSSNNPLCNNSGSSRVTRGGSWNSTTSANLRSASRVSVSATTRDNALGFRCARGGP
jgi:formylglycine-generating enzyme required for sulfatase activity